MSPKSMSACSPSETKCEKPIPREPAQSSMAVTSAPDCDTKASSPGWAPMWEKLALSPRCGASMPMQLGPRMRKVWIRAASSMACFCALSRPAVTTMAARVPRLPSSAISGATVAAGVQITARSGASGRAATSAKVFTPARSACLGLTGYSRPPNTPFEVAPDRTAHAGRAQRGTEDRDRLGCKEGVEVADAHGFTFRLRQRDAQRGMRSGAGPPQARSAPLGGSDPRSGGAWGLMPCSTP